MMGAGFSSRGTHRREDCPEGGKHNRRHAYSGEACQISKCLKCGSIKWRAYRSSPDHDQIRKDLANYEESQHD